MTLRQERTRIVLQLVIGGMALLIAAVGAIDLVPRVQAVEVVILLASAFGAGATLTSGLLSARASRKRGQP